MAQITFAVVDDQGAQLDARFTLDGSDVVVHSRGGTKGRDAINADYGQGLLLLVSRLTRAAIPINGAWVDSKTVQSLPLSAREILGASDSDESSERICALMATRMKGVRGDAESTAKGGNSTKRIRISTGFVGVTDLFAMTLGGVALEGDFRSQDRLPAEILRLATPEFVWISVQKFIEGDLQHTFGRSTDFDLIADDGRRFPPKAVFGVALSIALGKSVEPKHFSGGESSTCFRLLREAGYEIVPKDEVPTLVSTLDGDDAHEWGEGRLRLVSHVRRERARGLARAKKAQYMRLNGRLACERCGMNPAEHYGTELADACIEVHHSATHVSEMDQDHITTLADLQCLCANCHRLIHSLLRDEKGTV